MRKTRFGAPLRGYLPALDDRFLFSTGNSLSGSPRGYSPRLCIYKVSLTREKNLVKGKLSVRQFK